MVVVSSSEFRDNQRKFFDMASVQRVIIKRKNQFLELVPCGTVIPEAPAINEESNYAEKIRKELRESINEIKTHLKGEIDLPNAKDVQF